MTASVAKLVFVFAVMLFAAIRFPREYLGERAPVARADRGWRERVRMLSATMGLAVIPLAHAAGGFARFADLAFRAPPAWIGAALFAVALWLFGARIGRLGRTSLQPRGPPVAHAGNAWHLRPISVIPCIRASGSGGPAQALLLQNWLVALCGVAGFGILFFGRIGQEERLMLETFGEQYDAFARSTKRLVPWIY